VSSALCTSFITFLNIFGDLPEKVLFILGKRDAFTIDGNPNVIVSSLPTTLLVH